MTDLYVYLDRIKTYALNGTMGEINAPLTMRGRVADPPRDILTALQRLNADAAADAALRLLTNSRGASFRRRQA